MVIIRFIWMEIFFLICEFFVFLPLYIFGLITFPLFYRYAKLTTKESNINEGEYVIAFSNKYLNEILGNHEDGLNPSWWQRSGGTAYSWFIRNPICNMRFWPIVSTKPDPEKIGWIGTINHIANYKETGWFFCWQGFYSGFFYQGKKYGFWIGWKTNPRDKTGKFIDYRWHGLGTAAQFWKNK